MSAKYNFSFTSQEARRPLPSKLILAQHETETLTHVGLKLLAFLLFARERLQVETNLHDDNIPFTPGLIQLDYELRPALWVECGECSVAKLDKLAVKAPTAELWIVKQSLADAEQLMHAMAKEKLRRNRYGLVVLDTEVFDEVCGTIRGRNDVAWFGGSFEDPAGMQFELNGLWFELPITVLRF